MARPKPDIEKVRVTLLKKAVQLIRKRGFNSLTMRALATAAGISVGKLYHFFPGKDHLFLALEIDFFERLISSLGQALSNQVPVGGGRERLLLFLRHYYDFSVTNFDLYKLVTSPPKVYSHYIGTRLEPDARKELEAALGAINMLRELLGDIFSALDLNNEEKQDQCFLFLVNAIHGLILNSQSAIFPYISERRGRLEQTGFLQPESSKVIEQQLQMIVERVLAVDPQE